MVQIVELVETYRELTADLRDLYMSSLSNRINETMRILTIFSTFFIPLTFIVGIYGMNFQYADGARSRSTCRSSIGISAIRSVWAIMCRTAICLLVYFYRRGWIFRG